MKEPAEAPSAPKTQLLEFGLGGFRVEGLGFKGLAVLNGLGWEGLGFVYIGFSGLTPG